MSAGKQLVVLASVAAVTAFSLAHAQPARAASAGVYVLAPHPPGDLLSVEAHGAVHEKEFSIPYDILEPFVPNEIKKKVDGSMEGTAGCPTDFCSDLHWRVTVKSGFAFTEKGQPTLQAYPPQQYGADITAHAQVKINFDVTYKNWYAVLGKEQSSSNYSSHDLLINIDSSGKLDLWPILQSQVAEPQLSDSDGFVFDLT